MPAISEFAFLNHEKDVVINGNYLLDPVTNLLISYMVFVSDRQKPSKATHLMEMYSSFQLCCQGPGFICTCIYEDGYDELVLSFGSTRDARVPSYRFSSRESGCCPCNHEWYLRRGSFIRND